MAVKLANAPGRLIGYPVPTSNMVWRIKHEGHIVYVDTKYLFTMSPTSRVQVWCLTKDFAEDYPKEWQEIQAELALQKLKSS